MKTFKYLALSIPLFLAACQTISQVTIDSSQPPQSLQPLPNLLKLAPHIQIPLPELPLSKKPHGTIASQARSDHFQLKFNIHYPQSHQGFHTQAIDCNEVQKLKVWVAGMGIPASIYAVGADPVLNLINSAGCPVAATVQTVPSGDARVASVVAYDGTDTEISGSTLKAVFNLAPPSTTVELSYKSTPAAQVVETMLNSGDPDQSIIATHIDLTALDALIVGITGTTGTDVSNYNYTKLHPYMVNIPNLTTDLINTQGLIDLVDPLSPNFFDVNNPAYQITGTTVSGMIAGLVSTDQISVQLTDPATGAIAAQSNGAFNFANVPPGTWKVVVNGPPGYTVTGVPANITITEGDPPLNLGTITFTPNTPAITGLSQTSGAVGETILINGSNFHSTATGNVVKFGTVTVPTSDITVVSTNQLQVKVPTGATGNVAVTVSVGSEDSNADQMYNVSAGYTWTGFGAALLPGRNIAAIAPDPNNSQIVYAGVNGSGAENGVHRSLDSGATWTQVNTGLTDTDITELTIDTTNSNILYAGTDNGGVFKSIDSGANWSAVNTGLTNLQIGALKVDPVTPTTIYAGTDGGGVFQSIDSGANWTAFSNGLTTLSVRDLAIYNPPLPATPVIYAGTTGGGTYRTDNDPPTCPCPNGNWSSANNGLDPAFLGGVNVDALVVDPANPATIYAGGTGALNIIIWVFHVGVWRKDDPGNWFQVGRNATNGTPILAPSTGLDNMQVLDLAIDPTATTDIYAATNGGGIYRSTNSGTSWASFNTVDTSALAVNSIALNSLRLYIGTSNGVFRSN